MAAAAHSAVVSGRDDNAFASIAAKNWNRDSWGAIEGVVVPPHVSDPLDTLKEPPLNEAVVVPRMTPPGIPLLTTATGSVIAQPASASPDPIRINPRIPVPPATFVVVVMRAGPVGQTEQTDRCLDARCGWN